MGACTSLLDDDRDKNFQANDMNNKKGGGQRYGQLSEELPDVQNKEKRVNDLVGHKLKDAKSFRVSTICPQASMLAYFEVKSKTTVMGKHTWQRRYVEMHTDHIKVFRKQEHVKEVAPEQTISLRKIMQVKKTNKSNKYRVDLYSGNNDSTQKWSMLSDDEKLIDRWITAAGRHLSWLRELSGFPQGELELQINQQGVCLCEEGETGVALRYVSIMDIAGWGPLDRDPRVFSVKMLPAVEYTKGSSPNATVFKESTPVWWRLWTFSESNSTELGDYLLAYAYKKTYALRADQGKAAEEAKVAEKMANQRMDENVPAASLMKDVAQVEVKITTTKTAVNGDNANIKKKPRAEGEADADADSSGSDSDSDSDSDSSSSTSSSSSSDSDSESDSDSDGGNEGGTKVDPDEVKVTF